MSELLVPIHANALRLERSTRVIGTPSDLEILPWFDGQRDHNTRAPNLASAINAEPFSDHEHWLLPGVHVHWTLPDGLTRGSTRRSAHRSVRVDDLWFAPAPNRWLVLRQTGASQTQDKAWIVESDYVHPGTSRPISNPIAYPRKKRTRHQPPYLYLGRKIEVNVTSMEPVSETFEPMQPATSLSTYNDVLTALGPGDPLFAAHYPSCHSVFGLHDAQPPPSGQSVKYDVYGWYSDDIADPLQRMVSAMYTDVTGTISTLARRAHENALDTPVEAGARLTEVQWGKAAAIHLREQFGWSALRQDRQVPENILCHARVTIDPDMPADALPEHTSGAIGIGSSSYEAFAALLAGEASASLPEETENRLVQAFAATDLARHPPDLGQKLKEARHNEQFKGVQGHSIWVIRPSETGADQTSDQTRLTLPDNLAHELNRLNELQEAFNASQHAIEGRQQELFAGWHHYMQAAYPEGDADPFATDVDALRELIERTRLQPLENLQRQTGQLFHGVGPTGDMLLTDQKPALSDEQAITGPMPEGVLIGGAERNNYRYLSAEIGQLLSHTPEAPEPEQPFYGGIDGTYFKFALLTDEQITQIEVWAGSIINQIGLNTHHRMMVTDGVLANPDGEDEPTGGMAAAEIPTAVRRGIFSSKQELEERALGPNRARLNYRLRQGVVRHTLSLEAGELVTEVFGEVAHLRGTPILTRLGFQTSEGRQAGPWGTATFGVDKRDFRLAVPSGQRFAGLYGKSGDYLYGIGILTLPDHVPLTTDANDATVQLVDESNSATLAADVVRQHGVVLDTLRGLSNTTPGLQVVRPRQSEPETAGLHLGIVPGPRYWQPNDPVIVLDDRHVQPRERHGHDGGYHYDDIISKPTLIGAIEGGEEGELFSDVVSGGERITGIEISAGLITDSITFTSNLREFDRRGGNGGSPSESFALEEDEYISSVSYLVTEWAGQTVINQLRFATNKGRTFGPWGSSGKTGPAFGYEAREGYAICGFTGRSGNYLNALGVLSAPVSTLANGRGDSGTAYSATYAVQLSEGWYGPKEFAGNARAPRDVTSLTTHAQTSIGWAAHQGADSWDPLQIQWQAVIKPLTRGGNTQSGMYNPDFVTSSQALPMNHPDLEAMDKAAHIAPDHEYLAGSSIINPSAGRLLLKRLAALPNSLQPVVGDINGTPMVLPLGGFHDQLLMRKHEPQIGVDDPVGLPAQKAFTLRIKKAICGLHPTTPMAANAFHPIRSGEINIQRLRVIDTFGRSREWTPDATHTTRRMASQGQVANTARLPIRLCQPARLNFRWLSATHEEVESNAHPATSPVCGWLLANDLDASIGVYAASGELLGSVIDQGVWESAPGKNSAPRSWREIENPHLARVVRWLTTESTNDLTGSFLDTLDAALYQIDPQDSARHPPRALLVSRPVALVRARISLSLQHGAALDQSMRALRQSIIDNTEDSHEFVKVRFPVRLGEHGQLNDGLCGYWIEQGALFRDDSFHTTQGLETQSEHELIKIPTSDNLNEFPVTQSLADEPLSVSMLIDPRGAVHATTGILPVKSIAVPPDQYLPQLARLRVTFRTAPVLTPRDEVEIPLPAESGFSWTWLEYSAGNWAETPHHPTIVKRDIDAVFGRRADSLWALLIQLGRIIPDGDINSGHLMPGDPDISPDPYRKLDLDIETIERALHALSRSIGNVQRRALYRGRPVAREGWLELRPEPDAQEDFLEALDTDTQSIELDENS